MKWFSNIIRSIRVYPFRSIWRLALLLVMLFFLVSFYMNLAPKIDVMVKDQTHEEVISSCETKYYFLKDYAGIGNTLFLYDAVEPEFDQYWEIFDVYDDYTSYLLWYKASEEFDHKTESYKTLAAYYEDRVQTVYDETIYDENRGIIKGFINH